MLSLPKYLSNIVYQAAKKSMPELAEKVIVQADKGKEWEYASPSIITIFNKSKKGGSFGFASCQEMAQAVVNNLTDEQAIQKVELSQAGKGDPSKSGFFLNIFLRKEFIEKQINDILKLDKIKVQEEYVNVPHNVLVDFSSPNIAKNMHVGHLRSTIQGDSACRALEFLNCNVLRINHIGDWGTQFGMLIQELQDEFPNFLEKSPNIQDLQVFYQKAKKKFDQDEQFKKQAQQNVVKLQSGDEWCTKAWQMLCDISRQEFQKIYDRLDINVKEYGESFYNPFIRPLIEELEQKGVITVDKGAKCIFIPKSKVPVMIQKSDGGFNYDSTDMAALKYRIEEQKAEWIIYVTDSGQEPHFRAVFEAAKIAGIYDPAQVKIDHMGFGLVLQEAKEEKTGEGITETVEVKEEEKKQQQIEQVKQEKVEEEKKEEGKEEEKSKKVKEKKPTKKVEKIKTREGESVKLLQLLDEAKQRAMQQFTERLGSDESKVQITQEKIEEAAEVLGISSIKYYDLKQNRIQNYIFSFDKMLDPKGNTGVYLIYQYVRVCSILRKGNYDQAKINELINSDDSSFIISNQSEKELAMALLKLPEQVELALQELQMNRICDELYDISCKIGEFYNQTKVLGSEEEKSRILLLEASKRVMKVCFDLLGMKTIDRI